MSNAKNLVTPPALSMGEKIGMVAPAGKIDKGKIDVAANIIESWGYKVELPPHLLNTNGMFAGTDQERADDLQAMLDNQEIKAIFCARGGYGSIRILPKLNFNNFNKSPKWMVGYSDITVFHSHLSENLNTCSIHATMPVNYGNSIEALESQNALLDVLKRNPASTQFSGHNLNRTGFAEGILTGGNLSILYSLRGTPQDIDTDGKILFIEDLDEYLYHIDRIMMNLKLGGKLKNLAGLIIGGMSDIKEASSPFGKTTEEIILDAVSEYNYPVAFGFPAGHQARNLPLVMGQLTKLEVGSLSSVLRQ